VKVGSLCTGYGGIELGLAMAGEQVDLRWIAEFDTALAGGIYGGTDVPNLGDITAVDWSTIERVDLITAGFPCQPFSAAGAQQAEADPRYLWPAVRDAVAALTPDRVLLENVRNPPGPRVRRMADVHPGRPRDRRAAPLGRAQGHR
jgi:DNA (cytosine-5)-methyltransferase 1